MVALFTPSFARKSQAMKKIIVPSDKFIVTISAAPSVRTFEVLEALRTLLKEILAIVPCQDTHWEGLPTNRFFGKPLPQDDLKSLYAADRLVSLEPYGSGFLTIATDDLLAALRERDHPLVALFGFNIAHLARLALVGNPSLEIFLSQRASTASEGMTDEQKKHGAWLGACQRMCDVPFFLLDPLVFDINNGHSPEETAAKIAEDMRRLLL